MGVRSSCLTTGDPQRPARLAAQAYGTDGDIGNVLFTSPTAAYNTNNLRQQTLGAASGKMNIEAVPTSGAELQQVIANMYATPPAIVARVKNVRTINEMVGRVDRLEPKVALDHWKAQGFDFSNILYQPDSGPEVGRYQTQLQDHGLEKSLDMTTLLELCRHAIDNGTKVEASLPVRNVNRVVGTITGSEITRKWGPQGLPDDTIRIRFTGSAGQSFGAFIPRGLSLSLEGDANDYVGKGLSGGRILVYPDAQATFKAEDNILLGNVALYGATSGEAFFRGMAGERFCVRNSGATTVVEGVGDHGCEYMTGGQVIVLGATGRNFAAGMSGGVAYVYDLDGLFEKRLNKDMVNLYRLIECGDADIANVKSEIEKHVELTGSPRGKHLLANWDAELPKFFKVFPRDYERMLECFRKVEEQGLSGDEAAMAAFEENLKDLSRVGGN